MLDIARLTAFVLHDKLELVKRNDKRRMFLTELADQMVFPYMRDTNHHMPHSLPADHRAGCGLSWTKNSKKLTFIDKSRYTNNAHMPGTAASNAVHKIYFFTHE